MIKNKFLYFTSLDKFKQLLIDGEISNDSIAFINDGDQKRIWAQGAYFFCDANINPIPGSGPSEYVVIDVLDPSSSYPVQSKTLYTVIQTLYRQIDLLESKIPTGVATEEWVQQQLSAITNISPGLLQTLEDIAAWFGEHPDTQDLLDYINQKLSDLDVYTKTQANAIFLTREEYLNDKNPVYVTVRVNPTSASYYDGDDPITVNIQFSISRGTPDSMKVYINNNLIPGGEFTGVSSGSMQCAITGTGEYTIKVTATTGSNDISGVAKINVIKPTFIGFSAAETIEQLNLLDLHRDTYMQPTVSGLQIENNTSGNYLWVASPHWSGNILDNKIKVSTDAAGTFTVDMLKIGTQNGLNYWRSAQSVIVSNLQYWIRNNKND